MATSKAKAAEAEAEEMVVPGEWHEAAEGKVVWKPGHAKEVCEFCGQHPIDKFATGWTCEHKTVQFLPRQTTQPVGTKEVSKVSAADIRQRAAAMIAEAEALEAAEGTN